MVTVFTSTYNRAHTIEALYNSLKNQTIKDFEWIVINDGSVDNTSELFKRWCAEDNGFPIIYREVPNGGKHRAINKGVKIARSDAFFVVDSDDYLLPDAIKKAGQWFVQIADDPKFAGVSGLKGFSVLDPIGGFGSFDGEYIDASNLERKNYNLLNDKAEIYKASILKKYPFPEFEGENFITEAAIWQQIAKDGYLIRWYNEVIYICDYLDDGLTRNADKKIMENPLGYAYYLAVLESVHGDEEVEPARLQFYKALLHEYDQNQAFKIINIANSMIKHWIHE